ncbi:hypothetical protein [Staphylococcus aureus]|uniref:hypothetical protein n=1 Tax=Staphylococcus aureus TaxID=1280 RepID=UPI001CE075D9|nr:hypothetical protein [Staphylococcus aureus]
MTQLDVASLLQFFDFNAWKPEEFLKNGQNIAKTIGGAILGFLGVCAIVWGAICLGRVAFNKQQRGQYVVHALIALVIGGALTFGGYSLFDSMAQGGYDQAKELGD